MWDPLLSVIVPVYNEVATIHRVLEHLAAIPNCDKQIIIVNDGSTDGTGDILEGWPKKTGIVVLHHPRNRGKGCAIRTGLQVARGDITIIQDADLEYDPADIPLVVEPILRGECDVVYGSRYLHCQRGIPWSKFRLGVGGLNLLVRLLYRQRLTDEATCYKAFRTQLLRDLDLRARRFEFCPEVTAKVLRSGRRILDVPIRYTPRTAAEGKKIGWRDAWEAVWTLIQWRFWTMPKTLAAERPVGLTPVGRDQATLFIPTAAAK